MERRQNMYALDRMYTAEEWQNEADKHKTVELVLGRGAVYGPQGGQCFVSFRFNIERLGWVFFFSFNFFGQKSLKIQFLFHNIMCIKL